MSDEEQLPAEAREVVREVLEFAREIMDITRPLAPLGEEAVGIALDWARYWRYRNALRIRDRVNELHRERGITTKVPIPPRLGIPLLDAASMEDDPNLQELWAGLAANATDPNRRQDAKKIFTHVLSNIEPIDTTILDYLIKHHRSNGKGEEIKIEDVAATLGINSTKIQASLHNLARLGCLRAEPPARHAAFTDMVGRVSTAPSIWSDEGDFHLTSLATELLEACKV